MLQGETLCVMNRISISTPTVFVSGCFLRFIGASCASVSKLARKMYDRLNISSFPSVVSSTSNAVLNSQ